MAGAGKSVLVLVVTIVMLGLWHFNFFKGGSDWTTVLVLPRAPVESTDEQPSGKAAAPDRRTVAGVQSVWQRLLNDGGSGSTNAQPEKAGQLQLLQEHESPPLAPPSPKQIQPSIPSKEIGLANPLQPSGFAACESILPGGIPSPIHPSSDSNDVIFLNGYHWGPVYIRGTLESIRAAGCNAKIVFLAPHSDSFAGLLSTYDEVVAPFMPVVVIPMGCQERSGINKVPKEAPRPNHLFLFYAANQALQMPEFARTNRVVVHDSIDTLWFSDLFKFIPRDIKNTQHIVYAPALSALRSVGRFGAFCPGNSPISTPGLFSQDAHFFNKIVAASSIHALKTLLSKVGALSKNYTECSYQEALNTYLLSLHADRRVESDLGIRFEAWMSDFGPIAHHDNAICGHLKQSEAAGHRAPQRSAGPLISLCNTPNVAVLTARCDGIDRNPPTRSGK